MAGCVAALDRRDARARAGQLRAPGRRARPPLAETLLDALPAACACWRPAGSRSACPARCCTPSTRSRPADARAAVRRPRRGRAPGVRRSPRTWRGGRARSAAGSTASRSPIELAAARLRTLVARPRSPPASTTGSGCSPPGRGPRCPATRRCARSSTGAGICSTEPERAVARRLAVFAGGATAEAARAGLRRRRPAPDDVFDLLAALVDKSHRGRGHRSRAATRYRMLETIREYAGERLDEAGERAAAEAAHVAAAARAGRGRRAAPARRPTSCPWLARLAPRPRRSTSPLHRAVAAGDAASRAPAGGRDGVVVDRSAGCSTRPTRWLDAVHAMDGPAPRAARALDHAYAALDAGWRGEDFPRVRPRGRGRASARRRARPARPPAARAARAGLARCSPAADRGAASGSWPVDAPDPWVRGVRLVSAGAWSRRTTAEVDEERRTAARGARASSAPSGDRFGLGMVVHSLGELEDIAGQLRRRRPGLRRGDRAGHRAGQRRRPAAVPGAPRRCSTRGAAISRRPATWLRRGARAATRRAARQRRRACGSRSRHGRAARPATWTRPGVSCAAAAVGDAERPAPAAGGRALAAAAAAVELAAGDRGRGPAHLAAAVASCASRRATGR